MEHHLPAVGNMAALDWYYTSSRNMGDSDSWAILYIGRNMGKTGVIHALSNLQIDLVGENELSPPSMVFIHYSITK